MDSIVIMEIVLLVVSAVCFIVSFVLPERKQEGSGIDQELARQEVHEMMEKEKEAKVAKIKNEAEKKKYKMEVISAIAQTAQGAINAYSSAAAIPLVGYVIAPIAAAAAIAAGMLQVQALKKQQQASEAQGYSEG